MNIIDLSHQPEHIPTLAAWHHRQWRHLNPGGTLEERIDGMQGYLSKRLVPSTFICKCNGQLAGSAAIVASDMDTRPTLTPWLASVFVAPPFRNRGIGGRLVEHAMLQARLGGIETLYLFTPDQAAFYQKLGWQILSEENYRGIAVTVMQIHLQALIA
ncbi:MAG: GNAT family N-acetyltransferase [Methylomonas sp.]|jgi:GNAT superfamily N-acetyltransferase|uniref:GNAT family N-acetyltransferase n=1 Tax=Methylomonas sp. TaxID=418 RepID=UPI0025D99474|nr:GNAT family N-acetyltransferase [Methylomonas sp.]MCK9606748.1 GNAT family N-acetyltransferase [Methylomonas sp.]